MKFIHRGSWSLLLIAVLALPLTVIACDRDEGPVEELGEDVDNLIDDAQDESEDLGDKLEDAGEEVKEAAEDVKDELDGDGG